MKFSAVVFALGYLPGVHAEVCDDDQLCVPKGKPCTENPDECCQDLGCFGYPFYKKCQPPPYCLPEWYDCTVDIDCCDQFVCAENESGTKTCQEEEITTKTAPVPQAPSPPTSSPTPKNTEITKCPGDGPVRTSGACATGDPHITTFDGLKWDCMGHGEHIVLKSLISRRMIQGRYIQLATRKWSSMQAIAIQDEGDTPTVQVSKTVVDEGVYHQLGPRSSSCRYQLFVDGKQYDLYDFEDTEDVEITVDNGSMITVFYPASEFKISITFGYWEGCHMNVCVEVPDCDDIVGILGTPDGDPSNDWTTIDGTEIPIPNGSLVKTKAPFDYCQDNWCIKDEAESMFTYNQDGIDFEDFELCDLPYNELVADHIESKLTPEILEACGEDEDCQFDAVMSNLDNAIKGKNARSAMLTAHKDTCRARGAECIIGSCCEGLKCSERKIAKGHYGNVCISADENAPTCRLDADKCSDDAPCCDDLICTENSNGLKFCKEPPPPCVEERVECEASSDCCGDAQCVGPEEEKTCLVLPKEGGTEKLPKNEQCGYEGAKECVSGTSCMKINDQHICHELPTCWDKPLRNCDPADGMPGCCDGMACLPHKGRMLCQVLPECAECWGSCEHVECCSGEGHPESECKEISYEAFDVTKKLCVPKVA